MLEEPLLPETLAKAELLRVLFHEKIWDNYGESTDWANRSDPSKIHPSASHLIKTSYQFKIENSSQICLFDIPSIDTYGSRYVGRCRIINHGVIIIDEAQLVPYKR
jgi:hypothetical protein